MMVGMGDNRYERQQDSEGEAGRIGDNSHWQAEST